MTPMTCMVTSAKMMRNDECLRFIWNPWFEERCLYIYIYSSKSLDPGHMIDDYKIKCSHRCMVHWNPFMVIAIFEFSS